MANSSSGFSFGQPQPIGIANNNNNKSLFGTPASAPGGAFTLNTVTSTSTAQPVVATSATGFTLGAATGAPTVGFGLGQPAAPTTSSTGFNFGAAPVLANAVPALPTNLASTGGGGGGGGLFNFSNPAPTSTGFTLGGPTLAAPATVPNVSLGFALTGSTPASTVTGFPLGLVGTTAAVAPSTGFSFSSGAGCLKVTPSQAPVSSNVGLGGVGLGLGGAQPPSASTDANNAGSKSDGKSTKDQQMPQDLFATIAEFESKRNAEISASEENIRQTAAPFHKVGNKAVEIQKLLAELASEYLQLHGNAVNLKAEVMLAAEHVEMSRRTKDTPMALQGENKAPEMFFINLVRNFESEMIYCRTKIEEVSQCMQAINNPCETPEDIGEVLQREHDTLKELAAKVYAQHAHLVELSQTFKTKTMPNEHAFFRSESKEDAKTPASAVVRPVLGGNSSGLQVFQEQQQRAKAVTLGAAPPTMPLAQATTPSMFSGANTSNLFTSGGTPFGTSNFNLGSSTTTTPFGVPKPAAFGNIATNFGNTTSAFGTNTTGLQQQTSSPFAITSPFNTKPFGS
ncbi:hypothetical protein Pcinc_031761 [Petrolisthes cinctipes]|uniref:Nucleoporin p58/p45 n=1 Tax=Petrolisthes cinctipes TaxID=88211 RepID=A0AAE1K4E6_PETCI|nr:hypothetical protein Pcinc_031761 [Petrolisthes cinctipes]